MYYYMSLYDIPFLTSLKPIHEFVQSLCGCSLAGYPNKFVKIAEIPIFVIEM